MATTWLVVDCSTSSVFAMRPSGCERGRRVREVDPRHSREHDRSVEVDAQDRVTGQGAHVQVTVLADGGADGVSPRGWPGKVANWSSGVVQRRPGRPRRRDPGDLSEPSRSGHDAGRELGKQLFEPGMGADPI